MSLYKRLNSPYWYYHLVIDGKKYRGSTKEVTKSKANVYMQKKHKEILDTAQLKPIIGHTVTDCFTVASSLWSHTNSYKSFYLKNIASIKHDAISGIELSKLNTLDIRTWIDDLLTRGNSRSTVNQKLGILKAVVTRYSDDRGITLSINFAALRLKKADKQHTCHFDRVEETRILDYMNSLGRNDIAEFLICLCDIGGRFTSVLSLKWSDIDLKNRVVTMRKTKNGATVRVPMTNRVHGILSSKTQDCEPFSGLTYDKVAKVWRRMRLSFGLQGGTGYKLHAWRHTTGTRLAQAGVDIRTIQHWLGHSDIRQTARYTHVVPEMMLSARDKLEEL